MSARRATSLLATALLAACVATGVATPAFAKSSISLRVAASHVALGRQIHLTATGTSDDLGGVPMRLCVEERVGRGAWFLAGCGREGALSLSVRAGHAGVVTFRAELLGVGSHGHVVVDRVSGPVTVRVR
ncbi:hypothetical protein [Streptacidiphilus rugosus]|uniref:hypothetical protein n=1 Tax=Streptacidiphilus rugosus TaxID=405783 RepID=UPI00056C9AD0|nr:hypothetical protein [Streptacidiphilus rugosus]